MTQPSFRDVELLSAYLDGELPPAESTRLETRLKSNPQLHAVFDELSQSRAILRQLPQRRAPRNFTLTPKMAGVKPPLPRAFPVFRFASALAAMLFFFSFIANQAFPLLSMTSAAAPAVAAYSIGGGAPEAEAPAATQAPQMAPAAPLAPQDVAAPTATIEAPTAEQRISATAMPAQAVPSQAKAAPPAGAQAVSPAPVERQQLVPSAVEISLLILALLAGAVALFLRWQADSAFRKRNL